MSGSVARTTTVTSVWELTLFGNVIDEIFGLRLSMILVFDALAEPPKLSETETVHIMVSPTLSDPLYVELLPPSRTPFLDQLYPMV